jgi:hypothetical protein
MVNIFAMRCHYSSASLTQPWLLVSRVILFGLTMVFAGCGDKLPESSYDSIASAKNAGAIDRGWIPDYLPASSYDIHEIHRLSSPTGWCSFKFAPIGVERFRNTLQASGSRTLTVSRIESPDTTWWPALLEDGVDFKKLQAAGYELYEIETPDRTAMNRTFVYLFAVDWSKRQAFFYQTTRGRG